MFFYMVFRVCILVNIHMVIFEIFVLFTHTNRNTFYLITKFMTPVHKKCFTFSDYFQDRFLDFVLEPTGVPP